MPKSQKIYTPKFRLSFPNLFVPKAAQEGQKEKFSLLMLFLPGEKCAEMKTLASETARKGWPNGIPKLKPLFKDQGEMRSAQTGELYAGCVPGSLCVSAGSYDKPGVVNQQALPAQEHEIYPGCWCVATITASAYGGGIKGKSYAPGVSFWLQNVQKVADDEPIAGRASAESEFKPVEQDIDADEKLNTSDDLFD